MYVYVLQSKVEKDRHYVGTTFDLKRRLEEHNTGLNIHTNKFRPWEVNVTIWFNDECKAKKFEEYLKTGSGRAFAKKHF